MIDCPYCHGEGVVTIEWGIGSHVTPSGQRFYVRPTAGQPVWTEESCPECKGTGEVEDDEAE
jgi:DnaJ-class molecular chaperone